MEMLFHGKTVCKFPFPHSELFIHTQPDATECQVVYNKVVYDETVERSADLVSITELAEQLGEGAVYPAEY